MKFPFVFGSDERTNVVKTQIERKLAIISFSLLYDLHVSIPGGVLMDKRRGDGCTIYTFEMESLNRAIEWLKDAHVFVEYASRGGNCDELEQEMDDFMACYEEKERNSKKRLVVDSEGFKFYR